MKKKDLCFGNCVILRNESKFVMTGIDGKFYLIKIDSGALLSVDNFRLDLTNVAQKSWDIMKVYEDYTLSKLLWERKELPKLTEDEKVILKNLPDEWEWIARDENGELWIYEDKPKRFSDYWWEKEKNRIDSFKHLFKFIKWEDEEPYYIPDLLKEGL